MQHQAPQASSSSTHNLTPSNKGRKLVTAQERMTLQTMTVDERDIELLKEFM
jgi:hypothetical protein